MKIAIIVIVAVFLIYKALPVFFREWGRAAGYSGDFKKALSRVRIAAAISAKAKNKTLLGYMLMQNSMFREAINILTEVIIDRGVLPADKITAKVYRAMARNKIGEREEALEEAEELFASVKNTLTYALLGYLRQNTGEPSLEFCLEAYDYNCDDRDICDNLTVAYYLSGDLDDAEENAKSVIENFPLFVEGYFHAAQIAAKKGDKKAGLEYLDRIKDCNRTVMTTVSDEEIEALKEELENA